MALESTCGEEVPADHGLLTWLVSCATRVHRRFSVGRDGKTAYERTTGRRAVPRLVNDGQAALDDDGDRVGIKALVATTCSSFSASIRA